MPNESELVVYSPTLVDRNILKAMICQIETRTKIYFCLSAKNDTRVLEKVCEMPRNAETAFMPLFCQGSFAAALRSVNLQRLID